MLFFWLTGLPGFLCCSAAPAQYTADGTPAGLEEEIRWRVNRGRFDTASENQIRGTAYTDVPASTGPLAPNQSLMLAARHQSEDMAKQNLFQHATVPGSAYYNPTNQPNPWDRMQAEGYSWNYAGENIAAGYSGAEAAYVGWWNSTGHRQNMYNSALREIGDGYFYWSASTYRATTRWTWAVREAPVSSRTPFSMMPTPMGSMTRPREYPACPSRCSSAESHTVTSISRVPSEVLPSRSSPSLLPPLCRSSFPIPPRQA